MKNMFLPGRIILVMTILAAVFTPPLRAQLTWSGGGGDDFWSTGANWAGTPPTTGDALIFAGSTRVVNTNDISMTNAWLRFDSGGFKLWGNALSFTNGITNSTGVNQIGTDLNWSSTARNIHVAAGSELVIAGTELVNTGDHTNTGGGRIRLTGKHFQPLNAPATILNNIEYVIDGGSFSNAGGVRITSGITPTASTLILTNGVSMIQGLAAGAVRVGDFTGIQGTLIIDNSTLTGAVNTIHIPFSSGGIGSVIQRGGTNFGSIINFCNNTTTGGTGTYEMIGGVLGSTQIKKNATTSGTATISFDGSTIRAMAASTAFFTGLDTAEIKSGGLTFDNNGFNVTVNQTFTGAGGLTKIGTGTLTLGSVANAYSGGFTLNEGVVSLTQNNAFGTGTVTVNGGTMQPSASTGRNFTNAVAIGGNYTSAGNDNLVFNGNVTLTGDRTITVHNTAGSHTINGNVGETGGARSITKVGPGILALTGTASSYSGNTVVSNGVVQVNSTGRLGNEAGTLVLAGGSFWTSANRTVSTSPIGNPISLIADSEIATVSTASPADLSLTGVPTTTAGTLTFRNLAPSGTGTFEPRFAAGGFTFTSPISIINNTNGTSFTRLNFFNTNGAGDQTFSAVISGNGSIRRSASTSGTGGRTIFTAANTYSGLTTINDGTLVVNNTSGSGTGTGDIVLGPSGVLAGTGTVAGAVSGTGSVSPGASAGTFTIGNGLNLSTGGTNVWELAANTTSGAGTNFDRLVLTNGNLVLGGSSRVLVKFIGAATFPDSTNAFWQQTNIWKIVDLTGPATNPGLTIFSGVDGAAGNNAGSFSISADATGIYLTFTPGVLPPPPLIDPTIVGAGTTNAQLSWSSVAGATYTVQYKTNIGQVGWLNLTNLAATGTTTTIVDNTSPVPAERYYRVISP